MLPNDFIGPIAKETFGSRIPTKQMPLGRHKENGIFLGIGRQQVKSLPHFLGRKTTSMFLSHRPPQCVRVRLSSTTRVGVRMETDWLGGRRSAESDGQIRKVAIRPTPKNILPSLTGGRRWRCDSTTRAKTVLKNGSFKIVLHFIKLRSFVKAP